MAMDSPNDSLIIVCGNGNASYYGYKVEKNATNDGLIITRPDETTFECPLGGSSETITTLTYDAGTQTVTYINEAGDVTSFVIPTGGGGTNTDEQTLSLLGTILSISNGNSIDLCPAVQQCETLTTLTYDAGTNSLIYLDEDGNSNSIALPSGGGGSETITTLAYDAPTRTFTYNNEAGATVNHTVEVEADQISMDGEGTVADPFTANRPTIGAIGDATPPTHPLVPNIRYDLNTCEATGLWDTVNQNWGRYRQPRRHQTIISYTGPLSHGVSNEPPLTVVAGFDDFNTGHAPGNLWTVPCDDLYTVEAQFIIPDTDPTFANHRAFNAWMSVIGTYDNGRIYKFFHPSYVDGSFTAVTPNRPIMGLSHVVTLPYSAGDTIGVANYIETADGLPLQNCTITLFISARKCC